MTIFNDIANALESYTADECVITITDLALVSGTTGSLNVNETWKFKVNVENTGHMNMTDVSLHVEGYNGAHVSGIDLGPTGSWTLTSIATGSLTVKWWRQREEQLPLLQDAFDPEGGRHQAHLGACQRLQQQLGPHVREPHPPFDREEVTRAFASKN